MLARSLIREVAWAEVTVSASPKTAALTNWLTNCKTLTVLTLGILCSPLRFGWSTLHSHKAGPGSTMRAPCHRGCTSKHLIRLDDFFWRARSPLAAQRRSCRHRQILPGRSHSINHINHKRRGSQARVSSYADARNRNGERSGLMRLVPSHPAGHTMRIYGPNGTTLGSPTGSTRRTSSSGFSLQPAAQPTSDSRPAVAPKATANIDALLAMQGVEEDPLDRRKRSARRC